MNQKGTAKGFVFVGNPINVRCALPFEISDGLVLKRAAESQRKAIRKHLKSLGGDCDNCGPFERTYRAIPEGVVGIDEVPVVSYESTRLPSSAWRYYVVVFSGCTPSLENGCEEVTLLRAASYLTECPLRMKPVFLLGARWTNFTGDWEYFTDIAVSGGEVVDCHLTYLEDLRHCYSTVLRLKSSHPDIVRSIQMYHDLPHRLGYNELTTLGLFSVLESLLTHSPRGEYDSIGQQIRKKTALLERRLPKPIDYSCFGGASSDTVWKKLYEFRSRVAHGAEIDFERSLALLDDPYAVEMFLKTVLRSFLRGAIDEPDLYVDLKAV